MKGNWRYYLPNEGETVDDARRIEPPSWHRHDYQSAPAAAARAVELDWDENGGWERGCDSPFSFTLVDPQGRETQWTGNNHASVDHVAGPVEGGG